MRLIASSRQHLNAFFTVYNSKSAIDEFCGRTGATPRLASRARGWATAPAVYGCSAGVAGVLWHSFAKSHPDKLSSAVAPAAPAPTQTKEEPKHTTVEWAVFRTPAVLSIFACEIAYNNLTLTIETWAPTALASRFSLTPIQVGSLLAAPQAIRTFGGFVVAALESVLLRRGIAVLSIRKWMTAAAQIPEAVCAVGYGLAKTPAAAAGFYSVLVAAGLFNCALSASCDTHRRLGTAVFVCNLLLLTSGCRAVDLGRLGSLGKQD